MTASQRIDGDVFFDDKSSRSVDYGLGIEIIDLDGGDRSLARPRRTRTRLSVDDGGAPRHR